MCFASLELTGKMTSNFTMRKAGKVLENPSGGQVRQGVAVCREFPGFPHPQCIAIYTIRGSNKERNQMFCKKGNYTRILESKIKNSILNRSTSILNINAR